MNPQNIHIHICQPYSWSGSGHKPHQPSYHYGREKHLLLVLTEEKWRSLEGKQFEVVDMSSGYTAWFSEKEGVGLSPIHVMVGDSEKKLLEALIEIKSEWFEAEWSIEGRSGVATITDPDFDPQVDKLRNYQPFNAGHLEWNEDTEDDEDW